MLVLVGAAAVWWAAPLAVVAATAGGAVARAGIWRTAIEVPGLGSLNKVSSVKHPETGGSAPAAELLRRTQGSPKPSWSVLLRWMKTAGPRRSR